MRADRKFASHSDNIRNNSLQVSPSSGEQNFIIVIPPSDNLNLGIRGLRPNLLRADDEFVEDVSRAIHHQQTYGDNSKWLGLMSERNPYNILSPSIAPDGFVDLSRLSRKWLIVMSLWHNLTSQTAKFYGAGQTSNISGENYNKIRRIYMGYSHEEPFSHEMVVNPNCKMIISHMTEFTNSVSQNSRSYKKGYRVSDDDSVISADIFDDYTVTDNSYRFYITPGTSIRDFRSKNGSLEHNAMYHVEDDIVDEDDVITTSNAIENLGSSIAHSDKFNIPNNYMDNIVSAVLAAKANYELSPYEQEESRTLDDTVYTSLTQRKMNRSTIYGLDINKPVRMLDVVKEYDPEIINNTVEYRLASDFDLQDTTESNIYNVYYSILDYTINPLMTTSNILSIMFRYSSYDDSRLIINGGFTIEHIKFHVDMPEEEQRTQVTWFKSQLSRGIFDLIKQSSGDFILNASYDTYGKQISNLTFYDEQEQDCVNVSLNMLSGLTTPVVGTGDVCKNNTNNLTNMLSHNIQGSTTKPDIPFLDRDPTHSSRSRVPTSSQRRRTPDLDTMNNILKNIL